MKLCLEVSELQRKKSFISFCFTFNCIHSYKKRGRVDFFFFFFSSYLLYPGYFNLHAPFITVFIKFPSTIMHIDLDKTMLLVTINKAWFLIDLFLLSHKSLHSHPQTTVTPHSSPVPMIVSLTSSLSCYRASLELCSGLFAGQGSYTIWTTACWQEECIILVLQ